MQCVIPWLACDLRESVRESPEGESLRESCEGESLRESCEGEFFWFACDCDCGCGAGVDVEDGARQGRFFPSFLVKMHEKGAISCNFY